MKSILCAKNVHQKFQIAKGKGKFKRIAQNFVFHFDVVFWGKKENIVSFFLEKKKKLSF